MEYQSYEPIDADMRGAAYRNVIARFGPLNGERFIVGAHYDAFGEFPAADDNASGVAGLLELAHLLGKSPPSIPIELVAFTLEEPKEDGADGGFRHSWGGSTHHARLLKEQGAKIRVALAFDMIGYFRDDEGSQDLPYPILKPFYPSRGDFIAIIGKIGQGDIVRQVKTAMRSASDLPVYSLSGPAWIEGVDWSDHKNYWDAVYPAVMITDTSFYRNKSYHTENDTADRLDYERMAQVIFGTYAVVKAFGVKAD